MLKSLRRMYSEEQWENTVISPLQAKPCTVPVMWAIITDRYNATDLSVWNTYLLKAGNSIHIL